MVIYKKRIVDDYLEAKLNSAGAVLIQGPKWCGKTTTAKQKAKSILVMDDIKNKKQNIELANIDPEKLLIGDNPRLIDEWQLAPALWDAIRVEVDNRYNEPRQFILTGSATPRDKSEQHHSGAGRFSWVTMRTMSLFEREDSNGSVSLNTLFSNPDKIEGWSSLNLEDIAYLVCRGGWPSIFQRDKNSSLEESANFLDAIVYDDINRVDNKIKNSDKVKRFLLSYARSQGTQSSNRKIAEDISLDEVTISNYINALKKLFVIEECNAWNPNLRSKTAIRTSPTRYFSDPSIATESLKLGPEDLINDLETFGLLFETLCIRDLRIYSMAIKGDVYHYRDSNGLECDAVIHIRNGKYGLCEIKLGSQKGIDEGAANLNKIESLIDTDKMGKPSFKMVLTGIGNYGYKRKDGVFVVPIGALRD